MLKAATICCAVEYAKPLGTPNAKAFPVVIPPKFIDVVDVVAYLSPGRPVSPFEPVVPEPVSPFGPVGPVGPVGPGTVEGAPVGPVGPVGPVFPIEPVGPRFPVGPAGIEKFKIAENEFPAFTTEAKLPAGRVVVVPTWMVAACPGVPGAPPIPYGEP